MSALLKTVERMKRQVTNWETTFVKDTSDQELVSKRSQVPATGSQVFKPGSQVVFFKKYKRVLNLNTK